MAYRLRIGCSAGGLSALEKFFANSPSLELLDFLERLAPFSSPNLILRDSLPRLRR